MRFSSCLIRVRVALDLMLRTEPLSGCGIRIFCHAKRESDVLCSWHVYAPRPLEALSELGNERFATRQLRIRRCYGERGGDRSD